jgi:hypothetical protein
MSRLFLHHLHKALPVSDNHAVSPRIQAILTTRGATESFAFSIQSTCRFTHHALYTLHQETNHLRSLDQYFWYTALDGTIRLATSCDTPDIVPKQVNDYIFNPALFSNTPFPKILPAGSTWPLRTANDLLTPVGLEGSRCVGNTCYVSTLCTHLACPHPFNNFKAGTSDWQTHFELCETPNRGIGVFTRRAVAKGDVLGWYAGEVFPDTHTYKADGGNSTDRNYLFEMPVGVTSKSGDTDADVNIIIDASRHGNWTRFINHSCDPCTEFQLRRVGGVRIIAIEALRDVEVGRS